MKVHVLTTWWLVRFGLIHLVAGILVGSLLEYVLARRESRRESRGG